MKPGDLQFEGTRNEKGEMKLTAKPAFNPKKHQFIKFDKEAPSHRALLGASADENHPNYVEGVAIHSGGLFSLPKHSVQRPHDSAPAGQHRKYKLISDAMAAGPMVSKKPKDASPVKAVATALNVNQERSAKRKDTPAEITKRNEQIKKARGK